MINSETKPIFDQTLNSLFELKMLSTDITFMTATDRKKFFDMLIIVRQNYKNLECSIKNVKKEILRIPPLRMYIRRNIHPDQMTGWIDKLHINLSSFMEHIHDKTVYQIVDFIDDQYILLNSVVKVLNGDARLIGCSHPYLQKGT